MKRCTVCKVEKSLEDFYANRRSADGKNYRCKVCDTASRKTSRRSGGKDCGTFQGQRERRYKRLFGITIADYDRMLEEQAGRCSVCRTTSPNGVGESGKHLYYFAVDHCHSTGKVRGLLCNRCNRALGMFQDDSALLQRAIDYLKDCH